MYQVLKLPSKGDMSLINRFTVLLYVSDFHQSISDKHPPV